MAKVKKCRLNAVKAPTALTGEDIRMFEAQRNVSSIKVSPELERVDAERAAEGGTGPWSMAGAMFDAVFGGIGIDKVFGKKGFFQDTQENRQNLRLIKQIGKSALMNSSRGAIWEQQRIDKMFPDPDKLWRNPTTESKKFKAIRKILQVERKYNNRAIISARDPKIVSKLTSSNIELDKLLEIIGPAPSKGPKVGTTDGGYRFMGGNPADQANWKKVKKMSKPWEKYNKQGSEEQGPWSKYKKDAPGIGMMPYVNKAIAETIGRGCRLFHGWCPRC